MSSGAGTGAGWRSMFRRGPGPEDAARLTIDAWCEAQTYYWEHAYTGAREFAAAFDSMNADTSTIFLFDFAGDQVSLRHKPSDIWSGHRIFEYQIGVSRAALYLSLFQRLVSDGMRIETTVALDTHDIALHGDEAPVFCYQKLASERKMLLPDIDFFHHDWYQARFEERAWGDKIPAAIFAGSSTGGDVLSRDDVLQARPQRLRWALSALGRPQVDMFICDAVQCDSEETAELLRAQPYFRPRMSWPEQLVYRYLISVDGNGATCSRVVNSLRSGSVLFKSESRNLLYYFDGLRPYEHYIPVNDLNEVEVSIADLESGRLSATKIVGAANAFYETFLTPAPVRAYTRRLLERYARSIAPRAAKPRG